MKNQKAVLQKLAETFLDREVSAKTYSDEHSSAQISRGVIVGVWYNPKSESVHFAFYNGNFISDFSVDISSGNTYRHLVSKELGSKFADAIETLEVSGLEKPFDEVFDDCLKCEEPHRKKSFPRYFVRTWTDERGDAPTFDYTRCLSIKSAGVAFNNMNAHVEIGQHVLEENMEMRQITEAELRRISEIADSYEGSK